MTLDNPQKQAEIDKLTKTFDRFKPYEGILSESEILEYAPKSRAAAEIRLNRGENSLYDKQLVNWITAWKLTGILFFLLFLFFIGIIFKSLTITLIVFLIGILAIPFTIIYLVYILFFKKYSSKPRKKVKSKKRAAPRKTQKLQNNPKIKQIEDLEEMYFNKEEIARELVERRFEPPQITYDKFISVIDKTTVIFLDEVNNIKELINLNNNEQIDCEIENRIILLKSLIGKMEELSNELILTSPDKHNEMIDEIDNLISSLKEYD